MQSDYYSPSDKVVVDGNIVYANDLNKINTAVDTAFSLLRVDLDEVQDSSLVEAWANNDRGIRPDSLVAAYSSKANALEAKDWAQASGSITGADGVGLW